MESTFVGIDLGTMNTAGVTSHGARKHLATTVGWPKDAVARKLIGRDILFGEELEAHRKALHVIRPLEKGMLKFGPVPEGDGGDAAHLGSFDDAERRSAAAVALLKHLRRELQIGDDEQVRAVLGVPCQANSANKLTMLEIASQVFDEVMLIPEPFAIGYGLSQMTHGVIVDIGAGTIDVCHFFGGMPDDADQVSIGWGGDFVDEDFFQRVSDEHPDVQFSLSMARAIKEKHAFVGPETRPVQARLRSKRGEVHTVDLTRELRESCLLTVNEVVNAIQRLLSQVEPTYHAAMLRNIVLGGGGGQMIGLDVAIEERLSEYGPVRATKLYDSMFAGANGALQLAIDMPEENWQALRSVAATERRDETLAMSAEESSSISLARHGGVRRAA